MTWIVRSYDMHGARLGFSCRSSPLAQCVQSLLEPFVCSNGAGARFDIRLEHGHVSQGDQGMSLSWRDVLADGRTFEPLHTDYTVLIRLERAGQLLIDMTTGRVVATVERGAEWSLNPGLLTALLCELMAQAKHYVVHGASLAMKGSGGRRCLMILGNGGTGKTTTALALAKAGMRLMSDDATFVNVTPRPGPARLRVWGLPRQCKVHRRTMELLEHLRASAAGSRWAGDECLVDLRRLSSFDPHRELSPAILLFLQPRNRRSHRIEPMDKVQAVAELTRQNVRCDGAQATPQAVGAFDAMAQLAAGCQSYRLSVGPDLGSLHDMILALHGPESR